MNKVKSLKQISMISVTLISVALPNTGFATTAPAAPNNQCAALFTPRQKTIGEMLRKGPPSTREEREAIEARMAEISTFLKTDSLGLETEVDQLMNAARNLIFFGDEVVSKPQTVIMQGGPGYGKTRLIQNWVRLMGFADAYVQEDIAKDSMYVPYEKIIGKGRPSYESPELAAERPILDFVVNIDETQKLMDYESVEQYIHETENTSVDTDSTGDKLKKLAEAREKVAAIKASRSFWWQVLGNGVFQVKTADPGVHLANIDTNAQSAIQSEDILVESKARLAKLRMEKEEKPNDTNIDALVAQAESNVNAQERNFRTSLARLKPSLMRLKTECSEALGEEWAGLSLNELYHTLKIGPDEFTASVRANYAMLASKTSQMKFSRGIIIVTGNPEAPLQAIQAKATHKNGTIDVEAQRRAAINFPEADTVSYFATKMGPDPGWQSRWDVASWKPAPAFGNKQWRALIRQSLEKFKKLAAKETKLYTEKDVTLTVDESLIEYLFANAVSPQQGPRSYFDALNKAMTVLPLQLPLQMRRFMVEHNAWVTQDAVNLKVSFSVEQGKLVVADPNGKFVMNLDLAVGDENRRVGATPSNFPQVAAAQAALYQAARAVVGSVVFESLPLHNIEAIPTAEDTIDSLWKRPDVSHLRHMKAKMMVSMAGYLAEQVAVRNRGVDISPNARMDLEYISTMLEQLKGQIDERKELEGKKHKEGRDPRLHELFGWSLSEDRVLESLYKNDTAAAYRQLDSEVRKILDTQKDLVNALATNLLDKNEINAEQIKMGFQTYVKGPRGYQAMYAVVKRFAVGPNTSTDHLMNVQQIVNADPGSIRNPLPELATPYSLDRREFKTTKLGRFWRRMTAALNNEF